MPERLDVIAQRSNERLMFAQFLGQRAFAVGRLIGKQFALPHFLHANGALGQPQLQVCTRCGEILFIPSWEAYQRNSYKPLVVARDRPDQYRSRHTEGMGGGTVALIVLLVLALLGGVGYGIVMLI